MRASEIIKEIESRINFAEETIKIYKEKKASLMSLLEEIKKEKKDVLL